MAYTLNGVELPYGLLWTDEPDWTPYVQTPTYSLTGTLVLEKAQRQAGRPITLAGAANRAWITQETLDALRALLDTDTMTLITPDDRTLSVAWNHAGPPISAQPIKDRWPGTGEKYHSVVLKLLGV